MRKTEGKLPSLCGEVGLPERLGKELGFCFSSPFKKVDKFSNDRLQNVEKGIRSHLTEGEILKFSFPITLTFKVTFKLKKKNSSRI